MAWVPTYTVINSRAITENLFTYFETNQAEAIAWAHGSALKPVARFENSVADRDVPIYPALQRLTDVDETVIDEDLNVSIYTVVFELMVTNATPATAVTQAESYAQAFVSMIQDCPMTTLLTNTNANAIQAARPETQFPEIKGNEHKTDWLQEVIISTRFQIVGGRHE